MLTPHVRAIGRPAGPAQDDAVDSARVEGTPAALKSDLIQLIGQDQVLHRISDLIRYASDASPYRYLPQVVVLPRTVDDVGAILDYCARTGRHATFRAGDCAHGRSSGPLTGAFIVSRARTVSSVSCAWYGARSAGG
jgi:D-lactate dehydrogenase